MTDFMQTGIMRLRVGIEPTDAYGVDLTDTIGDLTDIRSYEAVPVAGQAMTPNPMVVQRYYERTNDELGFERPTYELRSPFCGYGSAIDAAATPAKTKQMAILESILGGYESPGAGSTAVASGSDADTLVVASGHGSRFKPGGVIWVAFGTTYQPSVVKSISSDTLQLKWAFTGTPANGAVVLNSLHAYLEEPSAAQTYLQLLWEAATNRDHIFLMRGMQATAYGVSMTLGEQATWNATLMGCAIDQDDSIATPQGGSAIAAATYDGGEPTNILKGGLLFGPMASTARTHICYSSIGFTPNVAHAAVPCPSGTNGIRQMWRQRGEAPTLTFTCPIEGTNKATWEAARDAKTKYQALVYAGGGAGDFRFIECGTLQIVDVVETAGPNGMREVTVTCKCHEDENATDKTTSFRRSPFRQGQA